MTIEKLDEALKHQPSWVPPAGFARKVVMRAAMDGPTRRVSPFAGRGFLKTAVAFTGAAGVLVIGVMLAALVAPMLRDTASAVDGYARFIEASARTIASRAVLTAWICAAASLALAASTLQRVRD